jgi:4-hydroxy-tetrahydrodipicolinate synthase
MFQGSIVALVTPFRDGAVDEAAFRALIERQISAGTDGLVPCGTTGESTTLSHDEHRRVVSLCIETAAGRVPVIAGTGSNCTDEAVELTRHAKEAGAAAALIVAPYYNKPTQEGLFRHYQTIHDAVGLPIIVYNIPGRCGVDIAVETMVRLAALPNIVAVKDATQDLARPLVTRLRGGGRLAQLSGEYATALPFLAAGGQGCISVTANVAPEPCAALQDAWQRRDIDTALALQQQLMPLHAALFCETNPAPAKYALSLLGLCQPDVRLPLVELSEVSKAKVADALAAAGLKPAA